MFPTVIISVTITAQKWSASFACPHCRKLNILIRFRILFQIIVFVYDIADNEATCAGETNKRQNNVRSDNEPEPGTSKRQDINTYINSEIRLRTQACQ